MSTGKVLLGVLAGVAVGAALGIIFAPDKGSATRKKISKKSDQFADELVGKFNEFIEGLNEKFGNFIKETARKGKDEKIEVEDTEAEVIADAK